MIAAEASDRNGHVVDDALCKTESSQEKVGTVFRFAEYIGNRVRFDEFGMVVSVVVHIFGGVGGGHHGESHEGVGLCLGFLQVVAAVVPASLQSAFYRSEFCCAGGEFIYHLSGAVFRVARPMKPRIGVAAALDAEEFDRGVLGHGVNIFTYDKGTGKVVAHFDAQTFIGGNGFRNSSETDCTGLSIKVDLVAHLVIGVGVCSRNNGPFACCHGTT